MVGKRDAWQIARRSAGVLLLLLCGLMLWGMAIGPRIIDEQFEEARIPRLPAQWQGKTVAFIADIQLGMWLDNEGTSRRIVQCIISKHPAAVLLGGDFIFHPTGKETVREAGEDLRPEDWREIRQDIDRVVELLRPLVAAGIPAFAVLGNHDYLVGNRNMTGSSRTAEILSAALEKAGIVVRRNKVVRLRKNSFDPLYLAGLDSLWARQAKPAQVLAQIPRNAPRIWLMHNPDVFERLPANSAPFAIAGYTHGGQIRIPGLPHWSWLSLLQEDEVTADGWIQHYGQPGNHFYVNRGISFSIFPIRLN